MIVAETEPLDYGHRWFLVDTETGERIETGQWPFTDELHAYRIGCGMIRAMEGKSRG